MSKFSQLKAIVHDVRSSGSAAKFEELVERIGYDNIKLQQEEIDLLLRWAVQQQQKNFSIFYRVLKKMGANVNFVDKGGKKSNLMIACQGMNLQTVEVLVKDKDLNLRHEDMRKKNCLFYAIQNKNKDKGEKYVRLILSIAPDLVCTDDTAKRNSTPLVTAIQKNRLQIIKTLIQFGADPNEIISDNGNSPIYEAVKLMKGHFTQNNKQIVFYLLQKGADPYLKNKQNKSAIDIADKYEPQILQMITTIKNSEVKPDMIINTIPERQAMFAEAAAIFQSNWNLLFNSENSNESGEEEEDEDSMCEGSQPFEEADQFAVRLTHEIEQYQKICKIDINNGQRQLNQFKRVLQPIVQKQRLTIQIYGSFATQLWLKHCDIDILLIPQKKLGFDQAGMILDDIYEQLAQVFSKSAILKNIKVPMIRVEMDGLGGRKNGRKFDITIMDANHNGQQHVRLIKQSLIRHKSLAPLFYVLKKLSSTYKLNDPKNGGVRSYALILMIITYLQQFPENTVGPNLGYLLLGFLHKFGYVYRYEHYTPESSYCLLFVPDPINSKNNLGKNTDAFLLQRMFKTAYLVLHTKVSGNKLGYLFQSKNMFM